MARTLMIIFSSLYAITPLTYSRVQDYAIALGFERKGVIKGACYMAKDRIHVPGVLFVLNLGEETYGGKRRPTKTECARGS
jgi:hypothetical protein